MPEKPPADFIHVVYHPDEGYVSLVNTTGYQLLALSNVHRLLSVEAMNQMAMACAEIVKKYPRTDLDGQRQS